MRWTGVVFLAGFGTVTARDTELTAKEKTLLFFFQDFGSLNVNVMQKEWDKVRGSMDGLGTQELNMAARANYYSLRLSFIKLGREATYLVQSIKSFAEMAKDNLPQLRRSIAEKEDGMSRIYLDRYMKKTDSTLKQHKKTNLHFKEIEDAWQDGFKTLCGSKRYNALGTIVQRKFNDISEWITRLMSRRLPEKTVIVANDARLEHYNDIRESYSRLQIQLEGQQASFEAITHNLRNNQKAVRDVIADTLLWGEFDYAVFYDQLDSLIVDCIVFMRTSEMD